MKPLKVIPFVMVDHERAMFLTTRRWKPEPYWCGHGRRTWVVPLRSDPTHGRRVHGRQEPFGAVLEVAGCDSPTRLRRRSTMPRQGPSAQGRADAQYFSSRRGTDAHA